ncbi:hypothetical protein F5883DRAFT_427719 [Diaporthe sp. PMI_573]|nr:hypothetical protein F5883DRAFT_427719 [Diaporthaceae sp. PMI_573]
MPTYLCHGFRWKRRSIRVYVVVQNLDDAAPEWIVKRGSPRSLIQSFYNLFDFLPECTFPPTRRSSYAPRSDGATADPVLAQDWSPVKVLEEHDPGNLDEVSRPYAYVADYVQRIDSSCSIVEEIARYEHMVRASREPAVTGPSSDETLNGKRDTARLGDLAGWFEQLRDQLQKGEEIRWYVVVNGDEEREWPAEGSLSRPETRAQMAHQTQYAHQQLIFEGRDRDLEMRREQLRRDLGYDQGGIDRLAARRVERRPPAVPDKDLPPLRIDVPMHPAGPSRPKTPKTPGKGSFRRLFGRSKSGEQTP